MIYEICNWWRNRNRLIYRYHDGKSSRYVDPIDLSLALVNHPVYTRRFLVDLYGDEDANQQEALAALAATAVDVFGSKPLDSTTGCGLTKTECGADSRLRELDRQVKVCSQSRK